MTEKRLEVPVPRDRSLSVRRGGRFGITIESTTVPQGRRDHLSMMLVGVIVVALGWALAPAWYGHVAMIGGAIGVGVAKERLKWMATGEEVPADP